MTRYEMDDDGLEVKTDYYHYDALGSVTGLSDENGKFKARYDYDAFGNLDDSHDDGHHHGKRKKNTYLFSSKEFEDHAGLYYFGARYYDPETGRWLTPDPLGFIDGPNRYLYVGNNPMNFVDPWGYVRRYLNEMERLKVQAAIDAIATIPGYTSSAEQLQNLLALNKVRVDTNTGNEAAYVSFNPFLKDKIYFSDAWLKPETSINVSVAPLLVHELTHWNQMNVNSNMFTWVYWYTHSKEAELQAGLVENVTRNYLITYKNQKLLNQAMKERLVGGN